MSHVRRSGFHAPADGRQLPGGFFGAGAGPYGAKYSHSRKTQGSGGGYGGSSPYEGGMADGGGYSSGGGGVPDDSNLAFRNIDRVFHASDDGCRIG